MECISNLYSRVPAFFDARLFRARGDEGGGGHVEGEAALRFDVAKGGFALEHDFFGDGLREEVA